jgi:dephospho-CoA kinase
MAQIKHTDIHIIAPVGLAGSGKSTAVEYFTAQGIPKIYGGGIMYSMMTEAGIDITWESQKQFREEMRTREGQDFILKRAIKDIHQLIKDGEVKDKTVGAVTKAQLEEKIKALL